MSRRYVCHPSTGQCDPAEHCSGTTPTCPPDDLATPGSDCNDGDGCTVVDECDALGECAGVPAITFDEASISFPPTYIGLAADEQTVTMTNNGNTALMVTGVTDSAVFPATPGAAPPFSLGPGANEELAVGFEPAALGTVSGTVSVDTASCSFAIEVGGNGLSQGLDIEPVDGDFGPLDVDGPGRDRIVTLTNSGSNQLSMNSLDLASTTDFQLTLRSKTLRAPITSGRSTLTANQRGTRVCDAA